jgi:nucleolar MIF4G domain-containing protein 1
MLTAVKNNNVHKLLDADDQQHLQHLQKVLKSYVKGSSETALNVSLDDLLNAGNKGKWFLVGSAWHGDGRAKDQLTDVDHHQGASDEVSTGGSVVVGDRLVELGRRLGMNTELRRDAFYTIMTCEDYVDAFEKLLRLIGKQQQRQREVVHILFKLCLHERTFNAFYACLLDKLCRYHRQFQVTIQFTVRDHLTTVAELAIHKLHNLADLIVYLVSSSALGLAVFKDVDFAELSRPMKRLLERVLRGLLLDHPQSVTDKVFRRIAVGPHLELLRDGLRLFLLHFLKHSKGEKDEGARAELEQRLKVAEQAMLASGRPQ